MSKNNTGNFIQPSIINALRSRVKDEKYKFYLRKITINKLRGIEDSEIRFDFPVTAIIGPNGSGKSTVLGAAGLYCKDLKPSTFFSRAGKYDDSMKEWSVEYYHIRPVVSRESIGKSGTMTASYKKAKWSRKGVNRPAIHIGITRTMPASERTSLQKFASGKFKANFERDLEASVKTAVQRILGKPADFYMQLSMEDSDGKSFGQGKAMYASVSNDEKGVSYSEFHFGAGEASIISIVSEIESAGENALILIEEIENGLHPIATRRLIEYLVDVARRKSCQIIFTTHSNDALLPLPDEAVWSVSGGKLNQGKLDVSALRALTGEIDTSLAIFTEDKFSKILAEESLRCLVLRDLPHQKVDLQQIEFHALGGESPVKAHTRHHNLNPVITFPVVGFLDGDQRGSIDDRHMFFDPSKKIQNFPFYSMKQFVFAFGDGAPESFIFDAVVGTFDLPTSLLGKLTNKLNYSYEEQGRVREICERIALINDDPHLLFGQIGDELDFLPKDRVERSFIDTWSREFSDDVYDMWSDVIELLPKKDLR